MSFFGSSYFKASLNNSQQLDKTKDKTPTPKREKQAILPKRQGTHFHRCAECQWNFRCSINECRLPDEVKQCYTCQPSNFKSAKTV